MKQVYYSITRTPRRAAILCLTTLGLSYAGIPTASAQQNPGTTYEVSLGNRGARNTVSDTTLTPGPLTSTAAGIEEFFSGAGAAGVGIRPTDGAPGAGFSTLIRGLKSFRGTAEPLFILDGVILNPTTRDAAPAFQNDESDYQAVQNTLASINPNDIEKIEVLKDAASTAIYGSQGANGVIVITTKMGNKGETVRYHSNIGVSTMGHDVEMLPASDYLAMMKQANPGFDAQGGAIDWSGQAVRTAITHSHHISVSGAKDRTRPAAHPPPPPLPLAGVQRRSGRPQAHRSGHPEPPRQFRAHDQQEQPDRRARQLRTRPQQHDAGHLAAGFDEHAQGHDRSRTDAQHGQIRIAARRHRRRLALGL